MSAHLDNGEDLIQCSVLVFCVHDGHNCRTKNVMYYRYQRLKSKERWDIFLYQLKSKSAPSKPLTTCTLL